MSSEMQPCHSGSWKLDRSLHRRGSRRVTALQLNHALPSPSVALSAFAVGNAPAHRLALGIMLGPIALGIRVAQALDKFHCQLGRWLSVS